MEKAESESLAPAGQGRDLGDFRITQISCL